MSEYIAKASIEPRDYRVVFLIQKAAGPRTCCFWFMKFLYNTKTLTHEYVTKI